jgi:endosialidase-like protein
MRLIRTIIPIGTLFVIPFTVLAQAPLDVPLRPWPAPLFWQPAPAENRLFAAADQVNATTPANSLVFVGMTPCRLVDTRNGSGFTSLFGPPNLAGGVKRTFPIQSSTTCSIPAIAQAYSFNITIVPPAFVDFVTVGPTPVSTPPTFSTLNGYVCAFSASACVISNAAIVPAGTSGSVDVYASQNTNLLIDINGYYAAQSGITLAQGTAASPSLSFSGDSGTGIFSSGAGNLNIASGGTSRINVASNGNVGIGTTTPGSRLHINGAAEGIRIQGAATGAPNLAYATFVDSAGTRTGYVGDASSNDSGTFLESDSGDVALVTAAGRVLTATSAGNVGIGTANPQASLHVSSTNAGSTSLTLENLEGQTSRQVILSNYGSTGGGLYWFGLDSAHTSSLLGPNLFVLRGTGGLAFSGSSNAEHMRITTTGQVFIGTTTPQEGKLIVSGGNATAIAGTTNSFFPAVFGWSTHGDGVYGISNDGFGVHGSSDTTYAGYFEGNVRVTGTLSQGSDARLKEGVANLGYGLREVLQLRPVTYRWKDKPEKGTQLGLIAQEVEPVVPEVVTTEKDGEQLKGLNYVGLVPVTIKAIQEQQTQIEEQHTQIEEQQKHIAELEEQKLHQQEQNRKLEERLAAVESLLAGKTN